MHARTLTLLGLVLLPAAAGTLPAAIADEASEYVVIVNPANSTHSIERRTLADMFLKRATRWPDGRQVEPVDQIAGAQARRAFTRDVLARSVAAVRSYWQQRIFSGTSLPPPEVASDAEVVRYVLQHPGAVGYVSRGTVSGAARIVEVER